MCVCVWKGGWGSGGPCIKWIFIWEWAPYRKNCIQRQPCVGQFSVAAWENPINEFHRSWPLASICLDRSLFVLITLNSLCNFSKDAIKSRIYLYANKPSQPQKHVISLQLFDLHCRRPLSNQTSAHVEKKKKGCGEKKSQ